MEGAKNRCENDKSSTNSNGWRRLACSANAQLKEQPGEVVELKSLPASVQQTINQKAAGGEVVQVKREDDTNGK